MWYRQGEWRFLTVGVYAILTIDCFKRGPSRDTRGARQSGDIDRKVLLGDFRRSREPFPLDHQMTHHLTVENSKASLKVTVSGVQLTTSYLPKSKRSGNTLTYARSTGTVYSIHLFILPIGQWTTFDAWCILECQTIHSSWGH
jgi:hypothetical protein